MIKLQSTKTGQAIRKLSVVSTFSKGITVGSGRNWRKKLMQQTLWIMYVCGLCILRAGVQPTLDIYAEAFL